MRRVVIISSAVPGDANTHPFHARREAFQAAGVDLAYVRAADLVAFALALRPFLDIDTAVAAAVNWCEPLAEGLVTRSSLLATVAGAAQRSGLHS